MAAAGGGSVQVPRIDLDRQTCHSFDQASSREWLLGNGMGGYAAGTVSGAATRRYHGLLIAALAPPLGRTLFLAGLELRADYQQELEHQPLTCSLDEKVERFSSWLAHRGISFGTEDLQRRKSI